MFQDSFVGGSIKVILNKSSKHKSIENKYLVSIQITWSRVPIKYSTKIYLSPEEFASLPTAKKRELTEYRKDISILYDRMRSIVKELIESNRMSHAEFKRIYANNGSGNINVVTLGDMFDYKIKALHESGKISTAKYYTDAKRKAFESGISKLKIEQLDISHIRKLDSDMRKNTSDGYIAMTMRALKHVVSIAVKYGYIPSNRVLFGNGGYNIVEVQGVKKALSKSDLLKIIEHKPELPIQQFYCDMWKFIYLANGMNAADLCHLTSDSIVGDEVVFIRRKTRSKNKRQVIIRAYIHPIMQQIIDRWSSEGKYLFPLLLGNEVTPKEVRDREVLIYHYINKHMNAIAKSLGLGRITTYVARHSFATILKKSGADVSFISEQMGHSSTAVTQHYLDSFDSEVRKSNSMLLTDINDNKKVNK